MFNIVGFAKKSFGSKTALTNHVKYVHNKIAIQCDFCDLVSNNKFAVKRHVQTVHEKLKPYKCEQCNRAFAKRCNMKLHMKIHLNSK